jgi:hypothetical protein
LRRTDDNNVELIDLKNHNIGRQCELDVKLEPGSYIILSRTSGCYLRRPQEVKLENVKLMDINENFHELFDLSFNDIFRKFDMLLNRELSALDSRDSMNAWQEYQRIRV